MPSIDNRSLSVALAKLAFDDDVAATTAAMIAAWTDADRRRLLQLADDEDLLLIAVARLRTCRAQYPSAFLDEMSARTEQRQQWSKLRVKLMHEALEGMTAAGIAVRTIKGFALGQDLYGGALLRDSHDIDLIVVPGDAHAAAKWLVSHGYEPACDAGWFADRRMLSSMREATFRSLGGMLEIDLHWRIDHPWSPQITAIATLLTDHARSLPVAGRVVPWFSAVNVALIQASNIVNSWDVELRSVVDFARSVARLSDDEAAELVSHFRRIRAMWVLRTLARVACRVCSIASAAWPAPIAELVAAGDQSLQPDADLDATEAAMVDEALGAVAATAHARGGHRDNRRFVRSMAQRLRLLRSHLRPGLPDFVAHTPAAASITLAVASVRRRLRTMIRS